VLALIPGHILYSARVDTDMPQLFSCVSAYVFSSRVQRPRAEAADIRAASGLSFGFLYLAKLLLAFLTLAGHLVPFYCRATRQETLRSSRATRQAMLISTVLLAASPGFCDGELRLLLLSGHWLLHWHIMKCNAVNIDHGVARTL